MPSSHTPSVNRDRLLLHQVHPVKLAFDVTASTLSGVLLWRRRTGPGIAVRYVLPVIGSAVVLRWADVDRLRDRARGRYVLTNMPASAQIVRLAGDTVIAYGSWRRRPAVILVGLVVVVGGWSLGLLRRARPAQHA